jgi:hypothetical protein
MRKPELLQPLPVRLLMLKVKLPRLHHNILRLLKDLMTLPLQRYEIPVIL